MKTFPEHQRRLHSASMTLPEFQRADSIANQGRKRVLRQGRSNRAALGQGSLFLLKQYIQCRTISLSSSVGTKEKAMATHSSTLAWKTPWMEEPGRLQSMGSLELDRTERLHFHFSLSCLGEGNGNPLQCSCLENPRDGGAWWAAFYGVAESWTRVKRLSSSSRN